MGTYKKYIDDLEIQKNNLVTTLNNKGVEATNAETLNTLVPKVANIEGAKEEQEKTASASPDKAVVVTPDTGKVLSKVTINTIPTTAQAVPTIAVSSGGLITVTSKQTEGYVKAGTKTPIKQLDVQGTKTITPSTSSQTAVSAYKFTTGAITVAGDANLTAANIKAGTKIFGITGTHAGQKTEQTKTVDLSMASGNQTVTPDSGKVLNKVIVNKPSTLIPDNIKKDVNIGGVVGTLESSSSSGGGGAYNIETTDNSDGTQNLIITDATGGSSGGNNVYTVNVQYSRPENQYDTTCLITEIVDESLPFKMLIDNTVTQTFKISNNGLIYFSQIASIDSEGGTLWDSYYDCIQNISNMDVYVQKEENWYKINITAPYNFEYPIDSAIFIPNADNASINIVYKETSQ